jgi:hypothetical protein
MKSLYSEELTDKICSIIASSNKGMHAICKEVGISYPTHLNWLRTYEEYLSKYVRAKEDQADFLSDEMLEISDHTEEDHTPFTGANVIQRDRLRIDTRKWIASKLKPKKYGDKLDIEQTVHMTPPLFPDVLADDSDK